MFAVDRFSEHISNTYPAILEGDPETGFGVNFPDLRGCVSAGDSANEAALNAQEALCLHLEGLIGEGLPRPPRVRTDIDPPRDRQRGSRAPARDRLSARPGAAWRPAETC